MGGEFSTMSKKQIERIEKMEARLDAARLAVDALSEAMDQYEAAQRKYYELANYYGSVQWMDDYDADEAGKLPPELKRGVLSEDAAYDLITDHRQLMTRLQKAVLKSLEEDV